jgi:putative tryptophan/tyrosine transport system substrate-binding protein
MQGTDPPHPQIRAFLQRMRELGYVAGSNLLVEMRTAEGNYERLPEILRELVAQKVDVIVAPANVVVQAAKSVTTSVPIVMVGVALPGELGFAQSLARPRGNMT